MQEDIRDRQTLKSKLTNLNISLYSRKYILIKKSIFSLTFH